MKRNATRIAALVLCLLVQTSVGMAQVAAPVDLGPIDSRVAKSVQPQFPEKVETPGFVIVRVTVNENGAVMKAEAVSGDERLQPAAVSASVQTTFSPYVVNGRAVKFSGTLSFHYRDSFTKSVQQALSSSNYNFDNLIKIDFADLAKEMAAKKSEASKNASDDDYARMLSLCAVNANAPATATEKFEYAIKACTEGIERFKNKEGVTDFYYYRGQTRYMKVRDVSVSEAATGKLRLFSEFLPKFTKTASEADYELAYDAASDLMTGLAPASADAKYKLGHLYEAEMFILLAVKKPSEISRIKPDSQRYAEKAKDELAKAEATGAEHSRIEDTRSVLTSEINKLSSESDSRAAFKRLDDEYSTANDVYTKSVRAFQSVLQAQQASAAPSVVPVCSSLVEMNSNFQKVKLIFGKMIELRDASKLGFLPKDTLDRLADDQTKNPARQAQINGAAEHFGCKLN